VGHQAASLGDLGRSRGNDGIVWFQVRGFAGDDESALTGFCVEDSPEELLQLRPYRIRMRDSGACRVDVPKIGEAGSARRAESRDNHDESSRHAGSQDATTQPERLVDILRTSKVTGVRGGHRVVVTRSAPSRP